jgi:hypothetical protein
MSTESEFTFKQKEHKCEKCNKFYSSKSSLCNHNKRFHKPPSLVSTHSNLLPLDHNPIPTPSNPIDSSSINPSIDNKFICKYCNKELSRIDKLNNHYKICKSKKEKEKQNKEYEELKNKMNEILKCMKIHPKTLQKINKQLINNNSNSNNTTNNSNNTINNNITLVKFGQENLKNTLTKKEIFQILDKRYLSLEESIKLTHFNEKHPELRNIYITNMRDDIAYVYNGGNKFEAISKLETINDLINTHVDNIELSLDTYREQLPEHVVITLEKFIKQIENDNEEYIYKKIKKYKSFKHFKKDQVKILIFNEYNKNKQIFNVVYNEIEDVEEL